MNFRLHSGDKAFSEKIILQRGKCHISRRESENHEHTKKKRSHLVEKKASQKRGIEAGFRMNG